MFHNTCYTIGDKPVFTGLLDLAWCAQVERGITMRQRKAPLVRAGRGRPVFGLGLWEWDRPERGVTTLKGFSPV